MTEKMVKIKENDAKSLEGKLRIVRTVGEDFSKIRFVDWTSNEAIIGIDEEKARKDRGTERFLMLMLQQLGVITVEDYRRWWEDGQKNVA